MGKKGKVVKKKTMDKKTVDKEAEKAKEKKDNTVKFTNQMIENYLYFNRSVLAVRACTSVSPQTRQKMFKTTRELTSSPQGLAYKDAKDELIEKKGKVPLDIDDKPIPGEAKRLDYDNKDLKEFLSKDSGIEIKKLWLPMEEFTGVSEYDMSNSEWIFVWKSKAQIKKAKK